ncbi:NADH-quinone oxidoreductase subunit D [Desulfovibrio sp. OttesenSCG-928-I05]|nr:NADH-quinone oxidoreductase subunit D [Desulfovibrio sp. OttesenSCG-928-I05]
MSQLMHPDSSLFDDVRGDFYTVNFEKGSRENTFILNLGPQHPSTHGVLRVLLELDGEYIMRAEPVLGYLHRMHEKMGEIKTTGQYMNNMGRVDYLHAMAWNWAWAGAAERLGGIEVPERAEYLRVIATELNRIASHQVGWGAYILDLGAFTPILYAFEDREFVLDLLQMMSGSRLTFSYFRLGGVASDVPPRFFEKLREFIPYMRERLKMYHKLVSGNMIFKERVEGIGIIDREMCDRYGATGPVSRGSGIAHDTRRAEPYSVYDRFDFKIPVYHEGCCLARTLVRLDEIAESLNILEQAANQIQPGPVQPDKPLKVGYKLPAGEAYFACEGGRGKIGVWVASDGGKNPYRIKLRAPGFSNLSLFAELAKGTMIADAIAILGSLDLVIPEVDR